MQWKPASMSPERRGPAPVHVFTIDCAARSWRCGSRVGRSRSRRCGRASKSASKSSRSGYVLLDAPLSVIAGRARHAGVESRLLGAHRIAATRSMMPTCCLNLCARGRHRAQDARDGSSCARARTAASARSASCGASLRLNLQQRRGASQAAASDRVKELRGTWTRGC